MAFACTKRDVDIDTHHNHLIYLEDGHERSWGTSTFPRLFMRFLPSFCFSRSLRLRLTSPAVALWPKRPYVGARTVSRAMILLRDGRLNGHLKLLAGDNLFELLRQRPAPGHGLIPVNDGWTGHPRDSR